MNNHLNFFKFKFHHVFQVPPNISEILENPLSSRLFKPCGFTTVSTLKLNESETLESETLESAVMFVV